MARPRKEAPVTTAAEIYQDKHGIWHGWVEFPRLPNKKRDRRHRKGRDEDEVRRKVAELERERDARNRPTVGRPPTVEEWFSTWLTDIAPHGERPLAPRSLDDYWSRCRNWIFPHLGNIRLPDLSTDDLDRLYRTMRKAGKAPSHILKTHAIIRRGLSVAVPRDKVSRNVAAIIDNPGAPAPPKKGHDKPAAVAILETIAGRRNALRWQIGMAIGPRQGEALALRWEFVDLTAGEVDVAWQIQRRPWRHGCEDPEGCAAPHCAVNRCVYPWEHGCTDTSQCRKGNGTPTKAPRGCPQRKRSKTCTAHTRECPKGCQPGCQKHAAQCPRRTGGGLVFCRPKGFKSKDTEHLVALPPSLVEGLRAHRAAQEVERAQAKSVDLWEEHDLVFCQPNGRPIDPRVDWEEWQEIQAEAGVPAGGTHSLRHTAGELLRDMGVGLGDVQTILGHADPRTTQRYAKGSARQTRAAAAVMEEGLFGGGLATHLATPGQKERPGLRAV
jgi:integrase